MKQSDKIHVLITTYGYPSGKSKGNPFVEDHAASLARNNAKVVVFLYEFISAIGFLKKFFSLKKMVNWKPPSGFKIVTGLYVNLFPGNFFFQKNAILFFINIRFRIYVFFNGKPDVIHHHYTINCPPYITAYLAQKYSIPYIITEHSPGITNLSGADFKNKLPSFYSFEEVKKFVAGAAFRISPSKKYADKYGRFFNSDFIEMPNVIPFQFSGKKLPAFPKSTPHFTFLSIGDLSPRKNHLRLIEAFDLKFKNQPNVFLRIAGDGPLYEKLIETINVLKLGKSIFLLGRINKEQVLEEIDKSNVIVVSSNDENLNTSMLEAMFRGNPVVSTDCGGHAEVINDINGLLSEKTIESLAEKMEQVKKNYHLYNSSEIIKSVKKYSEEEVMPLYFELYYSAINAKN